MKPQTITPADISKLLYFITTQQYNLEMDFVLMKSKI
jgi:hypothetical protein